MNPHHAPASPSVRKVRVQGQETGLLDKIEVVPVTTTPMAPDAKVAAANPVKKIPALVTDDGMTLFDSPVICEYLDSLSSGAKMFPHGKARWEALRLQAAARAEEHTSELQSLMRISYAVFGLKKKK